MSKTLATSHFMQSMDRDAARKALHQQGIKTSYNADVMIFSTTPAGRRNLTMLVQECNGLILEQKTWAPLVVPPRTLRNNINTEASNKFLHQGLYHIYKAQDGTCFNLYFYKGKWVISTARGHSMNDVKWDNNKTYQSIIEECLEKIGLTWADFTAKLDVKHCYSLGFRHPMMQKFKEGNDAEIYRLWFIQSVCLDPQSDQYLWSSDVSPVSAICEQEVYPVTANNMRDLYKLATQSLKDFIDTKSICYGFILRSVNVEQTTEHSDLYIESSLMRVIRKTWYENELIDNCHKSNWNKYLAITLHAYLDTENYEVFRFLFPECDADMDAYASLLQEIVAVMMQPNASNAPTSQPTTTQPNTPTSSQESGVHTVASAMLQIFKETNQLNVKSMPKEELARIYYSYLCHPSSLHIILNTCSDQLLKGK